MSEIRILVANMWTGMAKIVNDVPKMWKVIEERS
jgi:hypothetical protein